MKKIETKQITKYVKLNWVLGLIAAFAQGMTGLLVLLVLFLNHMDGINYWPLWIDAIAVCGAIMTIILGASRLWFVVDNFMSYFEED